MKPFNTFYRFIENRILSHADERLLNVHAATRSGGKSYSGQLEREAQTLQAKQLKDWVDATALATDPESPDRSMLSQLYDNLLLDNHLSSVIDSRILYCQRSPFKLVAKSGEENEELSELFERTWFEEFVKLTLFSRFQGATLIELFDVAPESGELTEINEIPQAYFNTLKGIITKTPGDDSGWPYKEGGMANFYLQVGKNKEMGMLQQMAPIVLAKKLGLGSWLDYIEKYGIPSMFITTDREDDARLKQLYEAATNFKSNNFMVGRGNEKFEFAKVSGGNAENFDKLIERANDEISKRVLGGSGLTDEKAFVGSAEIQFKLARDRFESDKLLIKNVINQGLIPRLAKLSPIYAPLVNYKFVWDDSEVFGSKELADLVDVLGRQFIMDSEYVEEKTGIPILGQKSSLGPSEGGGNEPIPDVKKKRVNGN